MDKKKSTGPSRNPNVKFIQTRYPISTWEAYRQRAKVHHRSFNGEVIHALERLLELEKREEEENTT